jgi:hypothetical protein
MCELDLSGSIWDPVVAYYEHDDEPSISIKSDKIFD